MLHFVLKIACDIEELENGNNCGISNINTSILQYYKPKFIINFISQSVLMSKDGQLTGFVYYSRYFLQ